jgi:hypothetical protein
MGQRLGVLLMCAFVLWGWDAGLKRYYPMSGYDTQAQCMHELAESTKETPKQHFRCLPGTIDPRAK